MLVQCEIHFKCTFSLQRDSAIFTASGKVDQKYDAYQKDIAIVSFYFNHPTVFEYTRYIKNGNTLIKAIFSPFLYTFTERGG